jgi:hypothetical protein
MCNESGDGMNEDESSLRHAKAEGRQELRQQIKICVEWADRCMIYGPADQFRDALRKLVLLSGSDRPDSERP